MLQGGGAAGMARQRAGNPVMRRWKTEMEL